MMYPVIEAEGNRPFSVKFGMGDDNPLRYSYLEDSMD